MVQSGIYFFKIIHQLNGYRQHLKDLFASTDSREIKWLSWLLVAVGTVWAAAAINIIIDNLFFPTQLNPLLSNVLLFIMVWSVAIWGLRQKPGFEELYDCEDDIQEVLVQEDASPSKYQRSALDQNQASKIAAKIQQAMNQDALYLDASLTLQKLAKHISTSPTIYPRAKRNIGDEFLRLREQFRIDAAKLQLEQSGDTILDIAMNVGFNAKSSFYTAFKKSVGMTPNQYRKLIKSA